MMIDSKHFRLIALLLPFDCMTQYHWNHWHSICGFCDRVSNGGNSDDTSISSQVGCQNKKFKTERELLSCPVLVIHRYHLFSISCSGTVWPDLQTDGVILYHSNLFRVRNVSFCLFDERVSFRHEVAVAKSHSSKATESDPERFSEYSKSLIRSIYISDNFCMGWIEKSTSLNNPIINFVADHSLARYCCEARELAYFRTVIRSRRYVVHKATQLSYYYVAFI